MRLGFVQLRGSELRRRRQDLRVEFRIGLHRLILGLTWL